MLVARDEVARWRGGLRWQGGEVARWQGGEVARWQGGKVASGELQVRRPDSSAL